MIAGSGADRGVVAPDWIGRAAGGARAAPCGGRVGSLRPGAWGPRGRREPPPRRFLLEAYRFLERVLVRTVQLVVQRLALDVLPVRRNLELQVRVRDLLQAHDDVQGHGARP